MGKACWLEQFFPVESEMWGSPYSHVDGPQSRTRLLAIWRTTPTTFFLQLGLISEGSTILQNSVSRWGRIIQILRQGKPNTQTIPDPGSLCTVLKISDPQGTRHPGRNEVKVTQGCYRKARWTKTTGGWRTLLSSERPNHRCHIPPSETWRKRRPPRGNTLFWPRALEPERLHSISYSPFKKIGF